MCDRSDDVQEAILDAVDGTGDTPVAQDDFYDHLRCDDITLADLGTISGTLAITDSDGDNEPLEDLVAGDFEGIKGISGLSITGAGSLPSGIFAGVGSAKDNKVEITFAKNTSEDVEQVGNYTPSTIPSHIFDDQETQQVFVLADDTNDAGKGTTKGFDADLYAGTENGHIFVMTNAATAAYILGDSITFANVVNVINRPSITDRGAGAGEKGSRIARFAVQILPNDDKDKGERNTWLFLFATDGDGDADNNADGNPANAANLVDLATVAVTDDD